MQKSLFRYAQGQDHSWRPNDEIDLDPSTTSTFMNVFQNNLADLFSILSTSVMQEFSCNGFKVKVNMKGQKTNLALSRAYCETRNFHRALIFVDFVGKAIHEFKFTTNDRSRSWICD